MITIPTTFTDSQKDSTCVSAILAGFETVNLIPEPVAAAFGYFVGKPIKNKGFNFFLFDLGGGTLDVCIFKCEKGQIEILSQNGDQNLGGRDFANILIDYFLQKLIKDHHITNLGLKKFKLMLECQRIKENLSTVEDEFLQVDEFDASSDDIIEISRNQFEELSTKLIEKIKTVINSALKSVKFNYDEVDKVLLVGGGSRMPMIKALLQNMFKHSEFCCPQQPDELVAVGAAHYAYHLNSLLQLEHEKRLLPLSRFKSRKRRHSFEENEKNRSVFGNSFGSTTDYATPDSTSPMDLESMDWNQLEQEISKINI